jgi:hypothetical protein
MSSAFDDVTEQPTIDTEQRLSENVADDFLEYFRSEVVGHEQEGWLMYLGLVSGYGYGDHFHINTLGLGEPGSGKSLTKNTVEALIPSIDKYTKTDASSNALLDSTEWDVALVAPLDEYDKIDKAIVEVLKSSNPEDGGYAKDRNVEDPEAAGGYSPTEVSAEANPWVVLYAPSSKKGGVNDELRDRALVLYFSNDRHTRRAIGRKEFGHEGIDASRYDNEYIYDAHGTAAALRDHVRGLSIEQIYDTDEDGTEYMTARRGDTAAYVPRWVWYAVEPIFSIDEDHTNRVYGIVANLIKASAIANHHSRETRTCEVYVDEDSTETETIEQYVATPQDVFNVVMCLPTLLSTTHQLTPLKRHILDAVSATEPLTTDEGTTVTKVQSWLDSNDIPHPARSTLKQRLDELAEEYYLQTWDSTAGPNGQADAYETHNEGALQPPRAKNLSQHARSDGVSLDEPCVSCDVDDPFNDVHDPLRDQPAIETIQQFREEFTATDSDGDDEFELEDAMYDGTDDEERGDPPDPRSSGDAALDSFSSGETDTETDTDGETGTSDDTDETISATDTESPTPSRDPEGPTERWLIERLQETDGAVFAETHDVTHYAGIVETDATAGTTRTEGTVLAPDHELWTHDAFADDRVITTEDARRELQDAFDALRGADWVRLDGEGGPVGMSQLLVADE